MRFSKNDPEVTGSGRGASPTYPGPYLTHFDENRLKHNYYILHSCPLKGALHRSEGFALTGYDIPGCVEDGAWMLRENSSVVAVVVAHPDLGNGQFSSFITTSALPECADRSVSSSEYRWSRN